MFKEKNAHQNAQDNGCLLGVQGRFDLDFVFGVMCALGCAP